MAHHICPTCGNKEVRYSHQGILNKFGNKSIMRIRNYIGLKDTEEWSCLDCNGYDNCIECGKKITEDLGLPFCDKHAVEKVIKNRTYDSIRRGGDTPSGGIGGGSSTGGFLSFVGKAILILLGAFVCLFAVMIFSNGKTEGEIITGIFVGIIGLILIAKGFGAVFALWKIFLILLGALMCLFAFMALSQSTSEEGTIVGAFIGIIGMLLVMKGFKAEE